MAETIQSGPENLHTLVSVLRCILWFQRITFFKNILNQILYICFDIDNVQNFFTNL